MDHDRAVEHPGHDVEHGRQPATAGRVALERLLEFRRAVAELVITIRQQALDGALDLRQNRTVG